MTGAPADDDTGSARTEPTASDEHLDDVADGCGCTEIWEHLSEQREAERTESNDRG